ncbi:MAG: antitoxin MazE-like protein [Gemmatimonadota bacterium]
MSGSERRKSSREKVRAHRERLRRQGLRPAEAHRQSLAVAESDHAQADQEFIDAISRFDDP